VAGVPSGHDGRWSGHTGLVFRQEPARAAMQRRGLRSVREPHDHSPVGSAARSHDPDQAAPPGPGRPDEGQAEVGADDFSGVDGLPAGEMGGRDGGHGWLPVGTDRSTGAGDPSSAVTAPAVVDG
jgi:hypothetical protein